MNNGTRVAIAMAIMLPVVLLGAGFAMAVDAGPELRLGTRSDIFKGSSDNQDGQPAEQLVGTGCVVIGCVGPCTEPVDDVESADTADTTLFEDDPDEDTATGTESVCFSCDVVLLNEYPDYTQR